MAKMYVDREYRITNKEYATIYNHNAKDKRRCAKYGMKPGQYAKMLEEQGKLCKICSRSKRLVIDHCHATGRVRGLICYKCNYMLGCARDIPEILRKAAEYLEQKDANGV